MTEFQIEVDQIRVDSEHHMRPVDQWNLNQILRVFPGTLMERSTYAPPPSNLTARRVTGREEPVPPEVSLSDNPLYGGPGKYQTVPRPKRKGSKAPHAKTRRKK